MDSDFSKRETTQKERMPLPSSVLWTAKETAVFLNVKESTIRNWVHIGYIPYIKFRGAVRFREKDIVSWLDRCAAAPRISPSEYASRILRERR